MNEHIEEARRLLASHASLIDTPYRHSARQRIDDWALENSWDVLTLLVSQAAELTRLRGLLHKAVDTVEGLADQQAMYDGWYEQPLAELKQAAEEPA